MSTQLQTLSTPSTLEHWYDIPVTQVPRNVLLGLVQEHYRSIQTSTTAIIQESQIKELQVAYDRILDKWNRNPESYPSVLPSLSPEFAAARTTFWRMIEEVLARKPATIDEHIETICAGNNAMQQLVWRELLAAKGLDWASNLSNEAHNVVYNELSSRPDGSSELDVENDYEEVPAALNHLKSVVGKCFTHRAVTYKVVACLTATEDVEPVYELHHGDSEKKYVSLSDLEMMMSES